MLNNIEFYKFQFMQTARRLFVDLKTQLHKQY